MLESQNNLRKGQWGYPISKFDGLETFLRKRGKGDMSERDPRGRSLSMEGPDD